MEKVIAFLQKNLFINLISAALIGASVFFLSSFIAKPFSDIVGNHIVLDFYSKNYFVKFFILLFSILIILVVNKGKLSDYGFRRGSDIKYFSFIFKVAGISIASLIFGAILFMGILNRAFPTENLAGFPEPKSLLQMILAVWVWSSFCEEVLLRGLVQSFMQKFTHIKLFRLSVPVVTSGLLFGAMHLSLFKAHMGVWFVCFIVFNTSVIGLTAAYYREKSGSLIPAFWVHFIANVVGSLPLIIKLIIPA